MENENIIPPDPINEEATTPVETGESTAETKPRRGRPAAAKPGGKVLAAIEHDTDKAATDAKIAALTKAGYAALVLDCEKKPKGASENEWPAGVYVVRADTGSTARRRNYITNAALGLHKAGEIFDYVSFFKNADEIQPLVEAIESDAGIGVVGSVNEAICDFLKRPGTHAVPFTEANLVRLQTLQDMRNNNQFAAESHAGHIIFCFKARRAGWKVVHVADGTEGLVRIGLPHAANIRNYLFSKVGHNWRTAIMDGFNETAKWPEWL